MNILLGAVLFISIGCCTSSPLLGIGKQDGGGLLGKVATLKQTVYERKREFLNGINEKVSKALWIPPWPLTTEETPAGGSHQHDPIPIQTFNPTTETPSLWWWQTTEHIPSNTVANKLPVVATTTSTTQSPPVATEKSQTNDDRLVFTVADTDQLEVPNVFMYARSSFIPQDMLLTDSMEYTGPIVGRGPPVAPQHSDRLIMV